MVTVRNFDALLRSESALVENMPRNGSLSCFSFIIHHILTVYIDWRSWRKISGINSSENFLFYVDSVGPVSIIFPVHKFRVHLVCVCTKSLHEINLIKFM